MKNKKFKFLGFEFIRTKNISLLKFKNKELYARVGDKYNFIGFNNLKKITNRKTVQPKIGKFNYFQIKGK